jgi:hypothetical protein
MTSLPKVSASDKLWLAVAVATIVVIFIALYFAPPLPN